MKTLIITHKADIDGLSPIIFLNLLGRDLEMCLLNAQEINPKITELIQNKEYKNYEEIFITDLTLDKNSCELIMSTGVDYKFHSFDHHASNLVSNNYPFGTAISINADGVKECATSLFYKYLLDLYPETFNKNSIRDYTELVRQNDTWDWSINSNLDSKRLSDLHSIIGRDNYIENYTEFLKNNDEFYYTDKEKYLLEIEEGRIARYFEETEKTIFHAKINGLNAGIVFAESHRSLLGNYLAEKYSYIYDFIVIINMQQGVSYRAIKDDIDVSKIAQIYGGGGHIKASGSPMDNNLKKEIIKKIFNDKSMFKNCQ